MVNGGVPWVRMGELKLDHPSEREHKYVQLNSVVSTYIDAHFKKTKQQCVQYYYYMYKSWSGWKHGQ